MAEKLDQKQQTIVMIPVMLGVFASLAIMRNMGHSGALMGALFGAVGGGIGGAIGQILVKIMGPTNH